MGEGGRGNSENLHMSKSIQLNKEKNTDKTLKYHNQEHLKTRNTNKKTKNPARKKRKTKHIVTNTNSNLYTQHTTLKRSSGDKGGS